MMPNKVCNVYWNTGSDLSKNSFEKGGEVELDKILLTTQGKLEYGLIEITGTNHYKHLTCEIWYEFTDLNGNCTKGYLPIPINL